MPDSLARTCELQDKYIEATWKRILRAPDWHPEAIEMIGQDEAKQCLKLREYFAHFAAVYVLCACDPIAQQWHLAYMASEVQNRLTR
jgi:hypothetical protein